MSTLIEMQVSHNGRMLERTVRLDAVPRVGTLVFIQGHSKHNLRVKQVLYRDGGGITLLLGDDEESWT